MFGELSGRVVADSSGGAYPVGGVCLVHRLVLPGKGARGQRGANSIGCLGASHRLPLDTGRIANGDGCAHAVTDVGLEGAGDTLNARLHSVSAVQPASFPGVGAVDCH